MISLPGNPPRASLDIGFYRLGVPEVRQLLFHIHERRFPTHIALLHAITNFPSLCVGFFAELSDEALAAAVSQSPFRTSDVLNQQIEACRTAASHQLSLPPSIA